MSSFFMPQVVNAGPTARMHPPRHNGVPHNRIFSLRRKVKPCFCSVFAPLVFASGIFFCDRIGVHEQNTARAWVPPDLASIPVRPQNFRLTSSCLQAKLTQVKMEMPEREQQKAENRRQNWENINVCQNAPLSEPSARAFGKGTKCPARSQGNSRFNMQNSPSSSDLIQATKSRLIKVNKGK